MFTVFSDSVEKIMYYRARLELENNNLDVYSRVNVLKGKPKSLSIAFRVP